MSPADENIANLEVCIEDTLEGGRRDSVGAACWRIIEDVMDSYRLAMECTLEQDDQENIERTVRDYIERAYGDL